nr:hypothetical protein [Lachnospiraceae bacterium]
MKSEKLQDAIGEVKDSFIQDADITAPKNRRVWRKWAAAAACLCLIAGGVAWLVRSGGKPSAELLPKITVPAYVSGGGYFEGLMYYSADELQNGNPWQEDAGLKTLPVYRNGCYDPAGTGKPYGLSEAEMTEKLTKAAQALGISIDKIERETDISNETLFGIRTLFNGGTLSVSADGSVTCIWSPGRALPENCHFTHTDTSQEEAEAVLGYLAETYASLLDFDRPEAVSWGDYSFDGEFSRSYHVYDAAPDLTEKILNYWFRCAQFAPDDEGSLMLIRLYDGLAKAEKLGDYPLISVAEAREKLLNGQYQTSVPEAMPGEKFIAKAELVYRTGASEETLLPYYRFYVELEDMARENGLKTFGAYYIPAVKDEYIEGIATYDGRFN